MLRLGSRAPLCSLVTLNSPAAAVCRQPLHLDGVRRVPLSTTSALSKKHVPSWWRKMNKRKNKKAAKSGDTRMTRDDFLKAFAPQEHAMGGPSKQPVNPPQRKPKPFGTQTTKKLAKDRRVDPDEFRNALLGLPPTTKLHNTSKPQQQPKGGQQPRKVRLPKDARIDPETFREAFLATAPGKQATGSNKGGSLNQRRGLPGEFRSELLASLQERADALKEMQQPQQHRSPAGRMGQRDGGDQNQREMQQPQQHNRPLTGRHGQRDGGNQQRTEHRERNTEQIRRPPNTTRNTIQNTPMDTPKIAKAQPNKGQSLTDEDWIDEEIQAIDQAEAVREEEKRMVEERKSKHREKKRLAQKRSGKVTGRERLMRDMGR